MSNLDIIINMFVGNGIESFGASIVCLDALAFMTYMVVFGGAEKLVDWFFDKK